jgi:hypothetical protein
VPSPIARAALVAACLVCGAAPAASQQRAEIAPFGGYRFGGDFFEQVTNQPVDVDGAPVVGAVFNVPLHDGLYVEGLFSHQQARFTVPALAGRPSTRWRMTVQHFQAGGLQEFGYGRARPFLTGLLGLTHYAAAGDHEVRFTVGAGGGVKLLPTSPIGVRLDGRLFATFASAEGRAIACSPGICLFAFDADILWGAEFTAGLLIRF